MSSLSLDCALSELADVCDDFETAGYRNAESVLARLVDCLDREPLASLQSALLPTVDFPKWWQQCVATKGGTVGSGSFNWATDRAVRVSIQLQLCRAIVRKDVNLLDVAHGFCYSGSGRFDDDLSEFSRRVLRPFLRDFSRVAELRVSPPVLAESLAAPLPETGDATLDDLLSQARDRFRDRSQSERRVGLEKLWDAWERLKTLDNQGDKRLSVALLLDRAAQDQAFRSVLENEASALTAIGNEFHIRHFETDRTPLSAVPHIDYLFHRMWAMMWLLLGSRR